MSSSCRGEHGGNPAGLRRGDQAMIRIGSTVIARYVGRTSMMYAHGFRGVERAVLIEYCPRDTIREMFEVA